jgi:hypothetical protein
MFPMAGMFPLFIFFVMRSSFTPVVIIVIYYNNRCVGTMLIPGALRLCGKTDQANGCGQYNRWYNS